MNFFKTIKNSIYSPSFYQQIPTRSFKSSFGYFLLLVLILTAIKSLTLIGPLISELPNQLQTVIKETVNCYPKDLEIKITNGQISTNVKEPYFIDSCGTEPETNQPLLVIDTQTPFSKTQLDQYKVTAWLTKDSIIYKKSDLETRSYSLTEIKDFKLNKTFIDSLSNMIAPWLKFVGPAFMFVAFIGIYLSYDFKLIYLLILAIVIWLIATIFKRDISYGQSYKLGLYAITLGLIVELLASLTSNLTRFSGFPFMFSLITLGVVFINYLKPYSKS